jgi:hypothetical protein
MSSIDDLGCIVGSNKRRKTLGNLLEGEQDPNNVLRVTTQPFNGSQSTISSNTGLADTSDQDSGGDEEEDVITTESDGKLSIQPFSETWYFPCKPHLNATIWKQQFLERLRMDGMTLDSLDNMGRVYHDYSKLPKLVPSIYYMALAEKNRVLYDQLVSVERMLHSTRIELLDIRCVIDDNIETAISKDWKDELKTIVKETIWPHIKAIVGMASENAVITMVSKKSNRSAREIAERRVAVVRYIKRQLHNHKGNSKRDIAKKCTGKCMRI